MSELGDLLRRGARCDRSGPRWRETLEFHRDNPWVYDRLKEMCFDLRAKGFEHYSTRTLIAVLRFEWDLASSGQTVRVDGDDREVRLNDHHTAYYARMIIEEHPEEFWAFFELRAAEGDPAPAKTPAGPIVIDVRQREEVWKEAKVEYSYDGAQGKLL